MGMQKLRKKTQVIELTQFDSEAKTKLGNQLFELLEIDEVGLTDIDKQYLEILGKKFNNVP